MTKLIIRKENKWFNARKCWLVNETLGNEFLGFFPFVNDPFLGVSIDVFCFKKTPPNIIYHYRNPSLGFATKARAYKVAAQEGGMGITSHAPKSANSAKNVREWTLTLPNELPLWELESQMDSQNFRAQLQGSKPIILKSYLYHLKSIET